MTTQSIKIKGVKSAIGNYNKCDNWNNYGIFYLDIKNNNVWCNIYNNCNSWTKYHDKNIISIEPTDYINLDDKKLNMKTLTIACQYVINERGF